MFSTVQSPSVAQAQSDVTILIAATGYRVPTDIYGIDGLIGENLRKFQAKTATPEGQAPAIGGPTYNTLKQLGAAVALAMAAIIENQVRT